MVPQTWIIERLKMFKILNRKNTKEVDESVEMILLYVHGCEVLKKVCV